MINTILVSIIIRTCGRPHILYYTLKSLREQTYKNFEIIVIEDGNNDSEAFINEHFKDLNIRYFAFYEHVGRTKAGNKGLEMAQGKYINFLDDDDQFYKNHIEVLVTFLESTKGKVAYSVAEEIFVKKIKWRPYFIEMRRFIRFHQPFNRLLLAYKNYLPIQTVMFQRQLYQQLGGFDEKLNYLEDWDLWVRYATITDFLYIPQITSCYKVPCWSLKKLRRDKDLYLALKQLRNKTRQYSFHMNVQEIALDTGYILEEYQVPKIKKYLRNIKNRILYN